MRAAFPDLYYRIEDELVTAESAVVRLTVTGTHQGDFFGIPPAGRTFRVSQINIERFRDRRIAEHWRVTDELGLLKQLGMVA